MVFRKGHKGYWKGKRLSEETKRKMSIAHNGKKLSKYHIYKIGESLKGHLTSKETRQKIGRAHKGMKHSEESKKRISEFKMGGFAWNKGIDHKQIQGENHWNWKGGLTTLNKKLRQSRHWKIWREEVFERDEFICQNIICKFCKNKGGFYLHPHHIIPVKECLQLDWKEEVFDIDNGLTLCIQSHKQIHRRID